MINSVIVPFGKEKMVYRLFGVWLLCILFGCEKSPAPQEVPMKAVATSMSPIPEGLSDVWYEGKAELNTYTLQQNRYADQHPGKAVLIFVTEDFRTDKLVKDEGNNHPDGINVLKANYIRRFTTGLYDYSIMTSTFTPVDRSAYPHTMKVSTSVQDWCGQIYMQVGKDGKQYKSQIHSYFEQVADQRTKVPATLMEDELFSLIRMAPEALPTGTITILPGTAYTRLLHADFTPQKAEVSLAAYQGDDFTGDGLLAYTVRFAQNDRTLSIVFQQEPPYQIEGWLDTYPSVFDGKPRQTIARRQKTTWSPYWKKNSAADSTLRESLGVMGF